MMRMAEPGGSLHQRILYPFWDTCTSASIERVSRADWERRRAVGRRAQFLCPAKLSLFHHTVDQAIPNRLIPIHETVAISVLLEALNTLAGVFSENSIQPITRLKHFLGVDLDIRGLPYRFSVSAQESPLSRS